MALANSTMSDTIKAEIIVEFGAAIDDAILTKLANALGRAVVTRFKADAVVTVNLATGGAAVATGAGAGGALSGSPTGTVA